MATGVGGMATGVGVGVALLDVVDWLADVVLCPELPVESSGAHFVVHLDVHHAVSLVVHLLVHHVDVAAVGELLLLLLPPHLRCGRCRCLPDREGHRLLLAGGPGGVLVGRRGGQARKLPSRRFFRNVFQL